MGHTFKVFKENKTKTNKRTIEKIQAQKNFFQNEEFQNLPQICSNQDSVILASLQKYRSMKQKLAQKQTYTYKTI